MEEEYRTIKGFENYAVSNFGNVKNIKTERILKKALDRGGYFGVYFCKNYKNYYKNIHRLVAMAFIENTNNKNKVDHIDNNKLNNHVENLRWVTNSENNMNSKLSEKNTSGIKGVYYHKQRNKWVAEIKKDNKKIHIGCFETKEEAAKARYEKAKELFGEYMNNCEKEITININNPSNEKLKINININ